MASEPIVIRITGHPVPQGRPRASVFAGRVKMRKPEKSRRWEQDARIVARQVMGRRKPLAGCLIVDLRSFIVPPRSWPAWKIFAALAGQIRPTGKPDVSNLLKAAEDALNGVVWIDDAQIVNARTSKFYGLQPEVVLTVRESAALPAQLTRKADLLSGRTQEVE